MRGGRAGNEVNCMGIIGSMGYILHPVSTVNAKLMSVWPGPIVVASPGKQSCFGREAVGRTRIKQTWPWPAWPALTRHSPVGMARLAWPAPG